MSFSDNGHFLNTTDVNFGFEWDFILKQEKEIASHKTLLNLAIQAYKGDKKPEFLLQWHTNQLKELKQFKTRVNHFLQEKNEFASNSTQNANAWFKRSRELLSVFQTPTPSVQTSASTANLQQILTSESSIPEKPEELVGEDKPKIIHTLSQAQADLEEWDKNLEPAEILVLRKVDSTSPLKQKVATWRDLSSTSSSTGGKSPVQKKWLEISQRASDLLKETPLHSQTPIMRRDMFFLRFKGKENSQKEQDTNHDIILAQKGWESTSDANQIRVCEELLDEHESTLQTKHSWTSSQSKSESETSEDVECDQSKSN